MGSNPYLYPVQIYKYSHSENGEGPFHLYPVQIYKYSHSENGKGPFYLYPVQIYKYSHSENGEGPFYLYPVQNIHIFTHSKQGRFEGLFVKSIGSGRLQAYIPEVIYNIGMSCHNRSAAD